MTESVLTEGDRNNATWKRLEKHLQEKLARLREQNDKDMPERTTVRLRGHIECVKEILSLGTVTPIVPSEDDIFKD